MDTKLTNFLTKRNLAGSIGDEFLQLLMWGKPKYVDLSAKISAV